MSVQSYQGACHCGAVTFEVTAPINFNVTQCNCSICDMTGFLHLIVTRDAFKLIRGEEHLSTYTFGSGIAKHTFCKHCGIKPFYQPRSHPDGVSVNVRCLEGVSLETLNITPFDGQNWEQNISSLRKE